MSKRNFYNALCCLLLVTCSANAQFIDIRMEKIASGFTSPVGLAAPDDGTGRLFVFEQRGRIYIIDHGKIHDDPFLNISHRIDGLNIAYSEKGLLGLAFHPNYKTNGRFFVCYSAPARNKDFDHTAVIAAFQVDPNNPSKAIDNEIRILEIDQPEGNHNGGCLVFGPDGYLYAGFGDGGGAGDKHGSIGNSQDLSNLLGKIIRIDIDSKSPYAIPEDNPFVNKSGARPEIFAYGLRNPWRFSFDSETGLLICGDVGQNKWEELNIIRKGGNYGWRIMEGNHCYDPEKNCITDGLIKPFYEYPHKEGISICGAHLYRGNLNPDLKDHLFFGDWNGRMFCMKYISATRWTYYAVRIVGENGPSISGKINAFGNDANGEIYIVGQHSFGPKNPTGFVYRLRSRE